VGIVDRLQALDERFLPSWAKPKRPGAPAEWTPEMGPLVSVKRLRELLAWAVVGVGALTTAFQLVSAGVVKVLIGTLVTAVIYGLIMSLVMRDMLETSLGLARQAPAGVPITGPGAVFKRLWPWLAPLTVLFVILALDAGGTVGGIVLGTALWQYREARWLGRWQDEHGVDVLMPAKGWRRGLYLRPTRFSGDTGPEAGTG